MIDPLMLIRERLLVAFANDQIFTKDQLSDWISRKYPKWNALQIELGADVLMAVGLGDDEPACKLYCEVARAKDVGK